MRTWDIVAPVDVFMEGFHGVGNGVGNSIGRLIGTKYMLRVNKGDWTKNGLG